MFNAVFLRITSHFAHYPVPQTNDGGVQAEDWYRQLQRSQQQTMAVAGHDALSHSLDAAAFDSEAGSSLGAPSEGAPARGADASLSPADQGKPPVRVSASFTNANGACECC